MSALRGVLGLSILVAIGCGGSTANDSLGDAGANGQGTQNEGDGSQATSSDSSTSSTGSSSGSGTVGTPPSTGDDGSVASGDDSGLGTVQDGSVVVPPEEDAGGGGPMGMGGTDASRPPIGATTPPRGTDGGPDQIECAGMACDSKTQVCCLASRSCIATNAACRGDVLACSGTNSCATGVCCQEATGRTTYTSKCEAKCPAGALQLCTTDADCTATDEFCSRRNSDYGFCERIPMPPPARDGGPPIGPPPPPVRDGGVPIGPPGRDGGVRFPGRDAG